MTVGPLPFSTGQFRVAGGWRTGSAESCKQWGLGQMGALATCPGGLGGDRQRRPRGRLGSMDCLWDPSWKHLEGWCGRLWASNRHRVNNQLECFSKHADPEPPSASPGSPGWGEIPGPLYPPDIQTQAQGKQTRGG